MKRIVNFARRASATFALCAAMAIASPAQTLTTINTFCGTGCPDGLTDPLTVLAQGANGNFYGTAGGGVYGYGAVFEITPAGTLTILHSFCSQGPQNFCPDGADPMAGLVLATNGSFYGTTEAGGAYGYGTVFKMTPKGELTTLYSFCAQRGCTDGANPEAALVQATNGDLYGTTVEGGTGGGGTVFKITPAGTLTTLYGFCAQSGCSDGENPYAGLVQATNGDLYGTTFSGGDGYSGTIFKITLQGALTTLYRFGSYSGADGYLPYGGLVQAANGDLYGTTSQGGAYPGYGTVFKMTPKGEFTPLYSFCTQNECTDGAIPYAGLVLGTDGNLYGTTYYGGVNSTSCDLGYPGCGTVFRITTKGTLTTLYSFCSQPGCADGFYPYEGLMQGTDGSFYGTTLGGNGTIFALNVGLGPFVETVPTSGKVGGKVTILGTDLTGATSVSFNGIPATAFTVNSTSSAITTTVPVGATSGTVQVVTSSGTLSSNVPFRVLP